MSYQISQNKGPKKMGHMGMKKPHINTDNSMLVGDTGQGPLTPSSDKQFTNINSPSDNDINGSMGAPYMLDDNTLKNYSNKFMEENNTKIKKNIAQNLQAFSHMNYNTDFLQNNKDTPPINNEDINNNTNDLMGYDNLYTNFDNYGNDRDIALVDTNIINTFQNRFIENPVNKLQNDIDVTGSSVSNKINGSNLNNLKSFQSIN
jgi:hypothetical protein